MQGDEAFEATRCIAQSRLDAIEKTLRSKTDEESELRRLHEIRTGGDYPEIELREMFDAYAKIPRGNPEWAQTRYAGQLRALFGKFADYCGNQKPKVTRMSSVKSGVAEAFLNHLYATGITAKTRNNLLVAMTAAFNLLGRSGSVYANPFLHIPKYDEDDSVPRQPFTGIELKRILAVATGFPFIFPIIIMAATTSARRGSCCLVRRRDVDLDVGIIMIKPAKGGARVRVPIFPLLRRVLEPIMNRPGRSADHVFPEQAEVYLRNPDRITDLVREVLLKAGFDDENQTETGLNAVRTRGIRRASVRSLHSFRTTWVTLALMAGVSEKLIQLVTGHKTLEVVLTHYFNPNDQELKKVLEARMPGIVTGGAVITPEAQRMRDIRILVNRLTSGNLEQVREELLTLLGEPTSSTALVLAE